MRTVELPALPALLEREYEPSGTSPGFTRFRRAAETPFNLVFEIRP